jgi:hypothetical protein
MAAKVKTVLFLRAFGRVLDARFNSQFIGMISLLFLRHGEERRLSKESLELYIFVSYWNLGAEGS